MPVVTNYVDPSLARGLAKGAVRSAVSRDKAVANAVRRAGGYETAPKSRGAAYRRAVEHYRHRSLGGLVHEVQIGTGTGKKQDAHLLVVWDATDDVARLGLGVMWLRARDLTAVDYSPLIVSQHACERVFERLRTTDLQALEAELISATMPALQIFSVMTLAAVSAALDRDESVLLPTVNGALALRRYDGAAVKPHLVATTWLGSESLKADQRARLQALDSGTLACGPAASPTEIRLPRNPWPAITDLMQCYGRSRSLQAATR